MIHCSWLFVAPSSSTSRGMATLRIVLSMTITSRLMQSAARVHHRRAYQGSSVYDALAVEVMVPALIVEVSAFFLRRVVRVRAVNFDTQTFRNCFYPELCPAGDAA